MIKFGIIGTGRIARRFLKEIEHVDGASISVVYNPHGSSAKEFVSRLQDDIVGLMPSAVLGLSKYSLPEPVDKVEDMWDKVDAVYISSPHGTHIEYAKEALEHGKHVLCEKPLALSGKEAEKVFKLARKKKLVVMEGLKTAYMPGFKNLCDTARSGMIGDIVHVRATFTKLVPEDSREFTDSDVAGSFRELGSYGMLAVFSLLGLDYKSVSFETMRNKDGVDIFTVADFKFAGAYGSVTTGIGVKSEGSLVVSGTKGYIVVPAPWWLTKHYEVHFEDPNRIISYDEEMEGDGLRYEIREFVDRVNGAPASVELEGLSIAMAEVMEKA